MTIANEMFSNTEMLRLIGVALYELSDDESLGEKSSAITCLGALCHVVCDQMEREGAVTKVVAIE